MGDAPMPAPAFDADIRHFPTLEAFVAYLRGIPRPSWCTAICNHNTYIPNETTWYGIPSVQSCMKTYIGKGWSAGPHLFLAAESPRASDRGIFQLTPLAHVGVHAGPCNDDHLGVENVGDFQARPPTPAQYQLLLDVNRAILQAWGLTPDRVNVHNECMPGRTCPGKYLSGAQIRADLAKPVDPTQTYLTRVPTPIFEDYRADSALAFGGGADCVIPVGSVVAVDKRYSTGFAHLADGRGFVPLGCVRTL